MNEAVAQLGKGLALLSGVTGDGTRQEHELNLQIVLGSALTAIKGWSASETGAAFARARELCEELNRPELLGKVLEGLFAFRLTRGDLQQAEHHAREIRELGEARNDTRLRCLGMGGQLLFFHANRFGLSV